MCPLILMQNIQDWVLALGVLVFVVIDILLLVLNLIISEALSQSELSMVPNRDNPRTVTGVSTLNQLLIMITRVYTLDDNNISGIEDFN